MAPKVEDGERGLESSGVSSSDSSPDDSEWESEGLFSPNGRLAELGRMALATILHGVGTGMIGIFIAELIRTVQVNAYGNEEHGFLQVAMDAQPYRRLFCVASGGVFGALAWYWLRGMDPAFVPVEDCMKGQWMPPIITLVNGMIQDIVVALGGSFGREAAPREIAAMWGCVLSDALSIKPDFRRILVACGTGAGLAAVYSVPISGVLYTIEHVLDWDLSAKALIPAVVTSIIATIVASVVVDPNGLYAMQKVSYKWPSLLLIAWAICIGPVCAIAALTFRRFVKFMESMKPQARIPIKYHDAKVGQWVRISSLEANGARHDGRIVERTPTSIRVSFDQRAQRFRETEEEFDQVRWDMANPKGRRDWKILVAMPTVFLVLGILSHDFPSLLGNGRALAEVAIGRERECRFFVMLLFLKALVTAGSIGAGAAGGTLTPSVALGATLGAIVGETLQYVIPGWVPDNPDDAPMSVITAAAFLGVAMRSPVCSTWLLIEFSAQGVDRGDLLAALQGNFQPLIDSKLAVGMVVPVALGMASAHFTVKAVESLSVMVVPPPPPTRFAVRCSSVDLDLGWKMDERKELELDDNAKEICHRTFGLGLLLNTCITVVVAASAPSCHSVVTQLSSLGVLASGALGCGAWFYLDYQSKKAAKNYEPLVVGRESESGNRNSGSKGYSKLPSSELGQREHWGDQWQLAALGLACATLVAVGGAIVPLAPWQLHVWRDEGGGFTALAVSAGCAVTAAACGAATNSLRILRGDEHPMAQVKKEVVSVAVGAAGAAAIGLTVHFLVSVLPGVSMSCDA